LEKGSWKAGREVVWPPEIELCVLVKYCKKPFSETILDELVRSQKSHFSVIPAKAGIQSFQGLLDSRLRGSDDLGDFLRIHHPLKG
jgi:hypothetical protein